jgi:serine protease Do
VKKNCIIALMGGLFFFGWLFAQSSFLQGEVAETRRTAITQAVEKVSPAVAGINVTAIQEYVSQPIFPDLWSLMFPDQVMRRRVKSLGSGVVISPDGYVVTNSHVVEGAEEIIITLMGGKEYKATLVGNDRVSDIALLKVEGSDFPYATLAESRDVIIGEWVIALGNPFGLFNVNYKPTATIGIVSGLDLDFGLQSSGRVYQDMIQTDAAINSGNSGGPLVNADGEVIGINTFIFTGSDYSEGSIGIGFAIPIDRVIPIVEEIKKYGKVDRSYKTGLRVQDIDRYIAEYLQLPSPTGVIVTEVQRNSAAAQANIKVGDVIIKINNRTVRSREDIFAEIQENSLKAGDLLWFEILRGKKTLRIKLELE